MAHTLEVQTEAGCTQEARQPGDLGWSPSGHRQLGLRRTGAHTRQSPQAQQGLLQRRVLVQAAPGAAALWDSRSYQQRSSWLSSGAQILSQAREGASVAHHPWLMLEGRQTWVMSSVKSLEEGDVEARRAGRLVLPGL